MATTCDPEEVEEAFIYFGSRDSEGCPQGRGTLKWCESGTRFEGHFHKGVKNGRGCFYFFDGSSLAGNFINDSLEGCGTYIYSDGRRMEAEYKEGELSGRFTEYDENDEILIKGFHEGTKRKGFLQIFDECGGVIWGEVDSQGLLTGENIGYIYPDLKHALVGSFDNGVMQKALPAILKNDVNEAIPKYEFNSTYVEAISYDKSTRHCISKWPLICDAYEQERVYVKKCSINDKEEGLFAKKRLPANEVVSFYNGIRLTHTEVDERDWMINQYTITVDEEVVLDVPFGYTKVSQYCATLGHKANHSEKPNCEYVPYNHPRFGDIMSIKTLIVVQKDEELVCNYSYHHKHLDSQLDDLPPWFIHVKKCS